MSVVHIDPLPAPRGAMALEVYGLTKRFGNFTALDDIHMKVEAGTVHALLGENGAGKSTLVKCIAGFHPPEEGAILTDGRERNIATPVEARALGIGMVYQHFTLAPGMSVAENLLLASSHIPAVVDWRRTREDLLAFLRSTPFQLDLDARPSGLAAGEKQKLELLKQLYLKPRLLILDEPTSVLTPQEADEVLGHVREFARAGHCTVLLITHKFREVTAYADAVTVLRRGKLVHHGLTADTTPAELARAMIGAEETGSDASADVALEADPETDSDTAADAGPDDEAAPSDASRQQRGSTGDEVLSVQGLAVMGDRGAPAVQGLDLSVRRGEILGVAGVSGNGQRELVEALVGQRDPEAGSVRVSGQAWHATRAEYARLKVRCLPEEPLRNACVGDLSVAENMALRDFDRPPLATRSGWGARLRFGRWRKRAREWIAEYGVKTRSERAPIRSLSGGNVQRAVLARELAGEIDLLITSNPVFGLDFAAVAEIHTRLRGVRDASGAVLLISEDLDELLELADRIVVMSGGRVVYETPAAGASRHLLGTHMGGSHAHPAAPTEDTA